LSAGDRIGPEREALLRRLVTDHFTFIWRLLRRSGFSPEDADDAAQQVFMTAVQKLEQVAAGSERTFLYGVMLRVAANLRRKLARRREDPLAPELGVIDERARPDRAAELSQARARLDALLGRLPAELARVLVLAELEGLSMVEIAELERIPSGTVASRLRRARGQFRELLTYDEAAPQDGGPNAEGKA
jgi:RNA polymerase sigma-70 factor (ECF subfamily)